MNMAKRKISNLFNFGVERSRGGKDFRWAPPNFRAWCVCIVVEVLISIQQKQSSFIYF